MAHLATAGKTDRSRKPAPGPPPFLKLPKIRRAVLGSGLKVIFSEYRQLPIVHCSLVIHTGCTADPPGKAGLANLMMNMIDAGTKKRTLLQIAEHLDSIGSNLAASTGYDGSAVSLQTLKEHLPAALELYSDVILHSTFPEKEFSRVKERILTSLLQQKDQAAIQASKIFAARLYGPDHPYGQAVDGTETSVKKITVEDLRSFFDTYFRPNNATLIVVGDADSSELVPLLEENFGSWVRKPVPAADVPEPMKPERTEVILVDKPRAPQSQIRIGEIGLPRITEDYFQVAVMNTILGGGFNSRLNWNLREQKGYTYGTRSEFQFRKGSGPFVTSGGFRTDVTDSSVIESLKEIRWLREEPTPEGDLRFAKDLLTRSLQRTFETPGQIAAQLAGLVMYGLPDNYFDTYVQNIEAVTAQDVKRVAEKHLHPESMLIVIVGDVTAIKTGLEKIGHGPILLSDSEGRALN